jgi:hypothetical protein
MGISRQAAREHVVAAMRSTQRVLHVIRLRLERHARELSKASARR